MLTLNDIKVFENVSEDGKKWFLEKAEKKHTEKGDAIFKVGDPADEMHVILEGKLQFMIKQGESFVPVAMAQAGDISGLLPFSRMKVASGNGIALEDCTYLSLHRRHFHELGEVSPELMQALVAHLSDRVRSTTRNQQQQEKMASLGKLSAGLAHEINNPAAAISRTSGALRERLQQIPEFTARLLDHQLTRDQLQAVTYLVTAKCDLTNKTPLTMIERGEWEDDLVNWMDDRDIEDSFEFAEALLNAGVKVEDLDEMARSLPEASLSDALAWINSTIESERLSVEIHEASERISHLVGSIKTYTHMDKSPDREQTQLHDGLDSTLAILGHKLKNTKINVIRDYADDLRTVNAYPGELNQVWTNILDNAIDALDNEGTITIKTFNQTDFARVDIIDDGPGIPEEIQEKIFDPFFTTKEVGKGSGLGLDIVQRIISNHNGSIKLFSEPGNTRFEICLPV